MSDLQSPPQAEGVPPAHVTPAAVDSPSAGSFQPPAAESSAACDELHHSFPKFDLRHRRLLQRCIAFMLAVLTIEWIIIATERPDPILLQRGDSFRRQFRIDINQATWVEWMQMEGIGPSLAHRIVADRKLNGRFQTIDDVGRVPGIGPATLDRIRPWLTIRHDLSEPKFPAPDSFPPLEPSADAHAVGRSAQQPAANDRQPAAF